MALVLVKYGLGNSAEKIKLQTAKDSDSIVLIQDGVFWALNDELKDFQGNINVVKEDYLARGYSEKDCKHTLLDYSELIDLIEKEEKFIG
ncbi:MAG: sulfurtransferase complex subunit TusB [Thermotogota bacterium]